MGVAREGKEEFGEISNYWKDLGYRVIEKMEDKV